MRGHNEEIKCKCQGLSDCPICNGKPLYSEPDKAMAPHPQMKNAWINKKNEVLLKALQDYKNEIDEAENTMRVRRMDVDTIIWELKWRKYYREN